MKLMKITLIAALFGVMAAQPVLAHARDHVRFGFYFGAPPVFWPYYPAPYYYYPPPYYYPPVVTVPSSPPVYIEQPQPQPQSSSSTPPGEVDGYWYYCAAAKAYYPYVRQCAGGWQRVSPQPPPPS
ncbi:MAG TPA: hypothetical protein VMT94_01215 [Burkholderiales bacterium]|nr:hypothetical protein [Burkholderiales bacterium]